MNLGKLVMLNNTVNRVTIIGIVERDPEIRQFPSGGQVCSFSVKTSEKFKDRHTGEDREISQINRVGVYVPNFITAIQNEVTQGDLVYIEGRMETRRSTDEMGNERFWTEVSIRPYHGSFAKLNSSSSAESNFPESKPQSEPSQWRNYGSNNQQNLDSEVGGTRRGFTSDNDQDDNIPF